MTGGLAAQAAFVSGLAQRYLELARVAVDFVQEAAALATLAIHDVEVRVGMADAHLQLGICMIAIKPPKPEQARMHFEKVIELDPDSPNAALAQEFLNSLQ